MNQLSNEKQQSIRQKIEISSDRFIILVDVSGRKDLPIEESNLNVYCIDKDSNIVWQISCENIPINRDSFSAIFFENDSLKARRFFGTEYSVDKKNGVTQEVGWNK